MARRALCLLVVVATLGFGAVPGACTCPEPTGCCLHEPIVAAAGDHCCRPSQPSPEPATDAWCSCPSQAHAIGSRTWRCPHVSVTPGAVPLPTPTIAAPAAALLYRVAVLTGVRPIAPILPDLLSPRAPPS